MNEFLSYLTKSSVVLAIFYLLYRALLASDANHYFNRVYLLASTVLAIVLPLVHLHILSQPAIAEMQFPTAFLSKHMFVAEPSPLVDKTSPIPYVSVILGIYLAGVIFFLGKLLFSLLKVFRFIKDNQTYAEHYAHYIMIQTNGIWPTSSVFKYILWDNTMKVSALEASQILSHEIVHVRQHHTWDLIFMQCIQSLLWFNPFIYFHKNSLLRIHDYLADMEAVRSSNPKSYLNLLAKQTLNPPSHSMAHQFSKSKTLNRMKMIQNNKRLPLIVKATLIMPVLSLLVYAFSCDIRVEANPFAQLKTHQALNSLSINHQMDSKMLGRFDDSNKQGPHNFEPMTGSPEYVASQKSVTFSKDESTVEENTLPVPKKGLDAFYGYIQKNIKYPIEARKNGVAGTVYLTFMIAESGEASDFQIEKGIGGGCDEEALSVIKSSFDEIEWNPGKENGKIVKTSMTLPITYLLDIKKQKDGKNIKANLPEIVVVGYTPERFHGDMKNLLKKTTNEIQQKSENQ